METWDTVVETSVELEVNGVVTKHESLEADTVKKAAQDAGIKKFTVTDGDGDAISSVAFPVEEGRVVIREYNEGK